MYDKFEKGFEDIQKLEPTITLMYFPYSGATEANNIDEISMQICNFFGMYSMKIESEI